MSSDIFRHLMEFDGVSIVVFDLMYNSSFFQAGLCRHACVLNGLVDKSIRKSVGNHKKIFVYIFKKQNNRKDSGLWFPTAKILFFSV